MTSYHAQVNIRKTKLQNKVKNKDKREIDKTTNFTLVNSKIVYVIQLTGNPSITYLVATKHVLYCLKRLSSY